MSEKTKQSFKDHEWIINLNNKIDQLILEKTKISETNYEQKESIRVLGEDLDRSEKRTSHADALT